MRMQNVAEGDEQAAVELQSWLIRELLVEPVFGTGPTVGALEASSALDAAAISFQLALTTHQALGGLGRGNAIHDSGDIHRAPGT